MSETAIHYRTCPLCEAMCGLAISHADGRIVAIRGDDADPLSKGHICPKAVALQDIHTDPLRLRAPLKRTSTGWAEIGWEEAFAEVTQNLRSIRDRHGEQALAAYFGNPTVHTPALLMVPGLIEAIAGAQIFSATSVDQLPMMLASLQMLDHQLLLPIPDVDCCGFLLIVGGNPAASQGSFISGGDVMARIEGIRQRGGRVVVIDPRRTETAKQADEHLFIRPGTDFFLLAAMAQVIFAEGRVRLRELAPWVDGLETLREAVAEFTPERVAPKTGIAAAKIRELALALGDAEQAAVYGRIGSCTQEFGGLCNWLLYALNIINGSLDRSGGMLFPTPPIDLVRLGPRGSFARRRTRLRGLPAFGDEFPVAVLAEEILAPGEGRIRALITHAGNPVLSTPNGRQLDRALTALDFMVSIDLYLNETTRHANIILPPAGPLERPHFDAGLPLAAVHASAKWSPPLFAAPSGSYQDWQIMVELAQRLHPRFSGRLVHRLVRRLGLERVTDWLLRLGPYGTHAALLDEDASWTQKLRILFSPARDGLSLHALRQHPHGIDLGAMQPGRLMRHLKRRNTGIHLAPSLYLADLPRALARLTESADAAPRDSLLLIGRRHVRSNNSWMHRIPRLIKGPNRCTLLLHPDDAAHRGIAEGDRVTVTSRVGAVTLPAQLTTDILPGVVSMPHGYGQRDAGASTAAAHGGGSMNDITDEQFIDALTGTPVLNGVPVTVTR
ncbi:MAG: dehydrogenase [Betaproteobacteria bacterium HGW-Betaproteobacteria-11]|nr:MAG: dehydrogenase [Betaproteobacteria bacterium HGW-Betaproteobacteria-11]